MRQAKIILLLIIICAGIAFNASGGSPYSPKQFITSSGWNFVENKGQLNESEIKYYSHQGGANLYCKPGMISFVFTRKENGAEQISAAASRPSGFPLPKVGSLREQGMKLGFGQKNVQQYKISTSRADLILLNSNPSAQIIASDQQEYYENFYLAHTGEEGITNVHAYKTITYKSIYPNIDFILQSGKGGLEYEFVVYPGGNVSDIQIEWKGIEKIEKLKNSGIEYSFGLGKMEESALQTYVGAGLAPAQSANTHKIESHFILNNNRIGFKVSKYDKTKPLVIDPFLSWATYFGGSAYDAGNAVAADNSGNAYITGYAESQSGIATSGAFQTSFGGDNEDAFLAKFDATGQLLWATYYGGDGQDYAEGVATDVLGDVFIAGNTGSASGIATSGAYQTSFAGGDEEAFFAKFNSNGIRQWATYFGGKGSISSSVATDGLGNVYFTGTTFASTGISTGGAYQTAYGGLPDGDAFLTKFNSNGSILWGTYYGGIGGEVGFGVSTDGLGNVYIVGTTSGSSGLATNGAYQTSNAGVVGPEDAFLAKFNSIGKIQWATYYGGNDDEDGLGVATDKSGNVFITGNTFSASGIATNGAYKTLNSGNGDGFLAKFSGQGKLQWATYYGGPYDDYSSAIAIDRSGNPFITGTTESSSGIATSGAYKTSFGGGNEDAFLAEFSNIGTCLWATYYGGSNNDDGIGIASDGLGTIYITGITVSPSQIATSGAYQTYIAGPQNAFLAQFNFKASYDAGLLIPPGYGNICAGKYPINVDLANYGNDPLDSVSISWSFNGKLQPVYHWKGLGIARLLPGHQTSATIGNILFSAGQKDTIVAWTSMPNGQTDSITWNDTSSIIINVNPLPPSPKYPAQTICEYSSTTIGAPPPTGFGYSWVSNPSGFTSTNSSPIVTPLKTTVYYEKITNTATGCSNADTVTITVNPAPPAITGSPKTICFKDTINIGDTASKGFTYSWTSAPAGFSSTISKPKISPSSTTSYTLTETNTVTGCMNANSVQITVNQLPVANVGQPSYSICNGTHVKIGANAQSGITYLWSSAPPGYSSTISNPVVDPAAYTNYYLTVTDTATGCVNENFAKVAVNILKAPLIDVGKNQAVCIGVSAQIGSIPVVGYTYSWTSNPAGFTSTAAEPTVKPLVTSSFSLVVTDTHGCTNFDSVTITVNTRPPTSAGAPQNACSGTVIKLGEPTDSGHTYLWSSKPKGFGSKISDPVDSPQVSTEYYLKEIISATGCADSDSVKIIVVARPNIIFDVKNINGYGYGFTIKKPNYPGWQYHWNFGDTSDLMTDTASGYSVTHIYPQNGSYLVVLTISLPGYCTVIDSYRVIVKVSESFDIFPNPFSLQTDIRYVLVNAGHVKITMIDDIGRFIGTLVDKQLSRGEYITIFDAGAWKTRPAVYFIIFQLDDKVTIKKIVQIDSIYH